MGPLPWLGCNLSKEVLRELEHKSIYHGFGCIANSNMLLEYSKKGGKGGSIEGTMRRLVLATHTLRMMTLHSVRSPQGLLQSRQQACATNHEGKTPCGVLALNCDRACALLQRDQWGVYNLPVPLTIRVERAC
eukprot:1158120-Pelagomonas_calceolata.AAC.2